MLHRGLMLPETLQKARRLRLTLCLKAMHPTKYSATPKKGQQILRMYRHLLQAPDPTQRKQDSKKDKVVNHSICLILLTNMQKHLMIIVYNYMTIYFTQKQNWYSI